MAVWGWFPGMRQGVGIHDHEHEQENEHEHEHGHGRDQGEFLDCSLAGDMVCLEIRRHNKEGVPVGGRPDGALIEPTSQERSGDVPRRGGSAGSGS